MVYPLHVQHIDGFPQLICWTLLTYSDAATDEALHAGQLSSLQLSTHLLSTAQLRIV